MFLEDARLVEKRYRVYGRGSRGDGRNFCWLAPTNEVLTPWHRTYSCPRSYRPSANAVHALRWSRAKASAASTSQESGLEAQNDAHLNELHSKLQALRGVRTLLWLGRERESWS